MEFYQINGPFALNSQKAEIEVEEADLDRIIPELGNYWFSQIQCLTLKIMKMNGGEHALKIDSFRL